MISKVKDKYLRASSGIETNTVAFKALGRIETAIFRQFSPGTVEIQRLSTAPRALKPARGLLGQNVVRRQQLRKAVIAVDAVRRFRVPIHRGYYLTKARGIVGRNAVKQLRKVEDNRPQLI